MMILITIMGYLSFFFLKRKTVLLELEKIEEEIAETKKGMKEGGAIFLVQKKVLESILLLEFKQEELKERFREFYI